MPGLVEQAEPVGGPDEGAYDVVELPAVGAGSPTPRLLDAQLVSGDASASLTKIRRISIGRNSLGEAILRWTLDDRTNATETCIVVATFNGVTAPLGAVAARPGVSQYEFADRVLNAYVGKKTYRIVSVYYDGTVSMGDKHVSITKNASISLGALKWE